MSLHSTNTGEHVVHQDVVDVVHEGVSGHNNA
jgi:hypothetical protein